MTPLIYNGRKVDLDQLKKLTSQGHRITVRKDQLALVNSDDHEEVLVVATSDSTYDVLAGTPKKGTQMVRLISRIILKKAVVSPPATADDLAQLRERWGYNPQRS